MQAYFYQLADYLQAQVVGQERFKCDFSAENSDFVRFNQGAMRQSGHVRQMSLSLNWIDGETHATAAIGLSGQWDSDRIEIDRMLVTLREQLPDLPPDPHFMMAIGVNSTEHIVPSTLPAAAHMVDSVLARAEKYDFVGILALGPMVRGFANSYGQRNWHESSSFVLDWSLYHNADKAVKTTYAGLDWVEAEFAAKFDESVSQLGLLARPAVSIPPGSYRAYLTPAAMNEVISLLNWDCVSEKALRTKQSALRKMREEGVCLNPAFSLRENTLEGLSPGFQEDGFIKPGSVALIEHGKLVGSLVSPRTAREYDIASNGAGGGESMAAIEMDAGDLAMKDALRELGTGVYVSNMWYTNFSDRSVCRITGMTRFATFWVENGEIKAPLNVMRFDDSVFSMLGENLLALTLEREMMIDGDSYGARGTNSARLPGALIKDLVFVL
jgi:predicted Zn-dependent protease